MWRQRRQTIPAVLRGNVCLRPRRFPRSACGCRDRRNHHRLPCDCPRTRRSAERAPGMQGQYLLTILVDVALYGDGPDGRMRNLGVPGRFPVAQIDESGNHSVIQLSRQVVLDLAARMAPIERQHVEDGVYDVPVTESRAVTVPRPKFLPWMRKGSHRWPDAPAVEIGHIVEHSPPFRLAGRLCRAGIVIHCLVRRIGIRYCFSADAHPNRSCDHSPLGDTRI